ncbi:MAG: hypothetical protein KF798_01580 [Candidatus Paracaedibacteraceae bacterium]|nr:hypothetical protein [Candidatus Paracaedibacteraceae bacterium]
MLKSASFVVLAASLSSQIMAADNTTLHVSEDLSGLFDVIKNPDKKVGTVPGILNKFRDVNGDERVKALCAEIKGSGFYKAAAEAGVGTLKNRAMVTWCEGVSFERSNVKAIQQREKAPEVKPEMPKLRPVVFSEPRTQEIGSEMRDLKEIVEIIRENAKALGKLSEVEQQLTPVEDKIKEAQDHYDNLGVAVVGMREDLADIGRAGGLKVFKPHEHENDSPEVYMKAITDVLGQENLTHASRQQIAEATKLLNEAQLNLAAARDDLVKINSELLESTRGMH